ncbi:MAG: helix-turn-helix domain-containing protein [Planctomycetota bacterium]
MPFPIEREDQIEALSSPVRQEIVDLVQASGTCSIAEMATWLGRPADSLYYHVRLLEKVGLLVPKGTRPAGPRQEALYDVPGRPLALRPTEPEQIDRALSAALRVTQRDVRAAVHEGRAVLRGRHRNMTGGRIKGWLTRQELDEVQAHLTRILEIFEASGEEPKGRLTALTYALVPLKARSRGRNPRGED